MREIIPAEVSPPGETIREEIVARGWTQNDLAEILGRPIRLVNEIIAAKRAITPETARGLADAFGTSAQMWLNLESAYQLSKVRADGDNVARRAELFALAPVKDMVRRGWIRQATDPEALKGELLSFFGASTVEEIKNYRPRAAARKSTDYATDSPTLLAWLRRVARIATTFKAGPYRQETFGSLRLALRKLVLNASDVGQVPNLLAEHGIRFLVVEHLPGTKLDGAAFWDDRGPVVVLTLRMDRLDHFWFTLIHELAHIFNSDAHDDRSYVIDSNIVGEDAAADVGEIESRAIDYAREFLVPKTKVDAFVASIAPYFSRVEVCRFAAEVGVHPGIIVGQLQRRGSIPYSQLRDLLVKVRDLIIPHTVTDGWGHVLMV